MKTKLDVLLNQIKGLGYNLSLSKLRNRTSVNDSNDIPSDRTFFCSELVAKSFKCLGVIENDEKSCSQYHPVHFSQPGDKVLKLTAGTSIDEEKMISIETKEDEQLKLKELSIKVDY